MNDWLAFVTPLVTPLMTLAAAVLAALFAVLAFVRVGRMSRDSSLRQDQLSQSFRAESDRNRQWDDVQARNLREELSGNLQLFQDGTLKAFAALGDMLANQIKEFGSRLDAGLKLVDERTAGVRTKLDTDIARMGEEANQHREVLRQSVETKLDESSVKQAAAAKEARTELTDSFKHLEGVVGKTLEQAASLQKERLEGVTRSLDGLMEKHEKAQEALRQTVDGRLEAIRTGNEVKLDEMRKTVDEKLQTTLDERLGQNFQLVSDQLQKVSAGLGEMQQLASGVGDLKRVLTQVKPRGIWGETQLGSLLEDFLAADQFARNVAVNPNSQERVEFAIRLPRLSDSHSEVFLPIDAKFPHEDFERIVAAADAGNAADLEDASNALERVVRLQAKDIAGKYIVPPTTTDYAVMYLPSEALYAEIARRPGLVESMQRECSVMVAGPSTLVALLNAIRVGFRSALIHRQAGEISNLLQRVRKEFEKYGLAVQTVYKRATRTVDAIDKLQTRQNVMGKALRSVDLLSAGTPIDAAAMLMDLETQDLDVDETDTGAEP
jgi:DNA recombination protein RmuC